MTPYPFTTAEMKAMAGVVQMVCVEENQAMIEQRKQGLLSDEKTCNEVCDMDMVCSRLWMIEYISMYGNNDEAEQF